MKLRTKGDNGGQERILDDRKDRRGYWMNLRTGEVTR
jgi:hypothetical protein